MAQLPVPGSGPIGPQMAVLMLLLAAPMALAGGEDPTPDVYLVSYGDVNGTITAGQVALYVGYPTNVAETGVWDVSLAASTSTPTNGTLAFTVANASGSGCSLGNLTMDAGTASSASGHVEVTATSTYCFLSFTVTLAGAANITTTRVMVQIASNRAYPFDGLQADGALMVLAWLVAFIWCLRNAKLFAALAAFVGIMCVLLPAPDWVGWTGVLFFVLALWLEAVAREKLPYHWFKGSKKVD